MYNLLMETEKGKFRLKLTAGRSKETEKELCESTYAHSMDTACEALFRRRKRAFNNLIDEKDFLPERITNSRYNFKFMENGILLLILGLAILIADIPTIGSGNRNLGILIFLLIFAVCLVIFRISVDLKTDADPY